jgi:hypothetical protein
VNGEGWMTKVIKVIFEFTLSEGDKNVEEGDIRMTSVWIFVH